MWCVRRDSNSQSSKALASKTNVYTIPPLTHYKVSRPVRYPLLGFPPFRCPFSVYFPYLDMVSTILLYASFATYPAKGMILA